MTVEIMQTSRKRKNIKAGRVKHNKRLFIKAGSCFVSPDEILMDKIINNIKQDMKGKDEKKTNKGVNSI